MRERKGSMSPTYRTRYAPSPTGPMHLGHLRTHLVAYLRARSLGGRIVMRIEDLDPPRVAPGAADGFLRDHAWLGLEWDEGPYHQSERGERYEDALGHLVAQSRAYPCTCSRKEIEAIASAPHGDEGPIYPGTCREGPTQPSRVASMRFRMPEAPPRWDDLFSGPSPEGLGLGDFVLRRADGLFAYQLAVVVDDLAMGVSEVVRGADLLGSTPRQRALSEALEDRVLDYLHLPLVLGDDGQRLAKRHGSPSVSQHREAGVSKERLLGLVAASLGLVEEGEATSLDELVARFSLDRLRAHAREARLVVPSLS